MYALHPFCAAFRRATEREKAEIVSNMQTHGYDAEQPITLYENLILDGGTRQEAAQAANVTPTFTTFTGGEDEARVFVIRRNIARKHMTKGELDLALARLATAKRGQQPGTPSHNRKSNTDESPYLTPPPPSNTNKDARKKNKTVEMVAKEGGRGFATVEKARVLLNNGAPNVIAMVEAGELGVATAAAAIRGKSRAEQTQMTAKDLRKIGQKNSQGGTHKAAAATRRPPVVAAPHVNLTQLDIGTERIPGQPVQLWPVSVQRLLEARVRVTGTAALIANVAGTDVQQFLDDVARMRSHQPVVGKKNGEENDFAKDTRVPLSQVKQHLATAIQRLTALREALEQAEESKH